MRSYLIQFRDIGTYTHHASNRCTNTMPGKKMLRAYYYYYYQRCDFVNPLTYRNLPDKIYFDLIIAHRIVIMVFLFVNQILSIIYISNPVQLRCKQSSKINPENIKYTKCYYCIISFPKQHNTHNISLWTEDLNPKYSISSFLCGFSNIPNKILHRALRVKIKKPKSNKVGVPLIFILGIERDYSMI